ncbi:MAG: hypothetical protein VKI83_03210 [Synechococcaceae cyanobacterium]|nr:hypothetical protein [Synechococcaceae cyanobacterium]
MSQPQQQGYGRWEPPFFTAVWAFLLSQDVSFHSQLKQLSHPSLWVNRIVAFNGFIIDHALWLMSGLAALLAFAILKGRSSAVGRCCCDVLGVYFAARMLIQLLGLNILVFDTVSSHFILITQLLFFLPYSLMLWGWIYWRLDRMGQTHGRSFFRVDHDSEHPRPIDYFVASFSTVFSASISNIKGTSARSRIIILFHGFMIYDIMGLTFSRAVALVQR